MNAVTTWRSIFATTTMLLAGSLPASHLFPGFAFPGFSRAWAVPTSETPAQAAAQPVVQPVETLISGLLRVMRMGQDVPFEQRFDTLAPIIDQTFNLAAILRDSVGLTWSSLPAAQQDTLRQAFRRYTVASYVNSFDAFNGQRFEVDPDPRLVDNGVQVVRTKIIPASGDTHTLDYVMRYGSAGWKVVDVLADGAISRVAVQRSDFRRLLSRGGAQALATQLQNKTANLSGGSSG